VDAIPDTGHGQLCDISPIRPHSLATHAYPHIGDMLVHEIALADTSSRSKASPCLSLKRTHPG